MVKRFNKGDIVYWCNRKGHEFSVKWGMVDEQFDRSVVYVDYLSPKEIRLVNGVPIDEFKSEEKFRKLPKGWSYDTRLYEITCTDELKGIPFDIKDPKSIKELYDKELLVKDSTLFHGVIEAEITNKGLTLAMREWTCPECGTIHYRDLLAAINIKRFAFRNKNTVS